MLDCSSSAELRGEDAAKEVELAIEYAPHPPFGTGSPELVAPELTQKILQQAETIFYEARKAVKIASARKHGCEDLNLNLFAGRSHDQRQMV